MKLLTSISATERKQRHGIKKKGISLLEAELEKVNLEITNKQAEAAAVKAASGTNGNEVRLLEDLKWRRQKISERIIQEMDDLVSPGPSPIQLLIEQNLPRSGATLKKAWRSLLSSRASEQLRLGW